LDYLTTHTSLSPIRRGFVPSFVNYKKGCTRLAAASDKVYQLLAHGRWFSPGTSASSTTKTGRHDIVEILLKVALNTKIQIQSTGHSPHFQVRDDNPKVEGGILQNQYICKTKLYFIFHFDIFIFENKVQYSQRHTMINLCDRHITHLGDLDIIIFCSIKYIFQIFITFRVLLTTTQKACQNK
jgi:hypothetical protein